MKVNSIIFLPFFYTAFLFPQDEFTEMTTILLIGVGWGSVAWGDYDNDGDLDILLSGYSGIAGPEVTKIYRNDGIETFTEQTSISLIGVDDGSVAWGDYDNDGDLDILLTGRSHNLIQYVSKIYRNNGNNTFSEQTELFGVGCSSAAWGDYDNDGDLDILITGGECNAPSQAKYSKIYRNNGDNTFTEQTSISLTGVFYGSVAWGDYDNDGDLDILLTGKPALSKIYRNDGDNTFTEQTAISLMGVSFSSVAWGDYNNDGYLDILMTGYAFTGQYVSKIYRNNGDNTFSEQTTISLTGVWKSDVGWGDYDNDGDLDILLTGDTGPSNSDQVTKIYRNNGNNTFTEVIGINLAGVVCSSVAWGDYDNDGDMDILLTGITENGSVSKIYRNNNITPNSLPVVPSNLQSIVSDQDVTFSWDKSTDNETPQNGLKYNLVIGTTPNAINTLSPMSDRNTGYRRVINLGNTNHNNSWTMKGLDFGQPYYWSVQAIDNCFAASEFAPEQSVLITSGEEEQFNKLPTEYELIQNFPNPFNPSTTIRYKISNPDLVQIKLYDILGREVETLVNEYKQSGTYEIQFDASGLASGIYLYRIESGNPSTGSGQGFVQTRKMILLK